MSQPPAKAKIDESLALTVRAEDHDRFLAIQLAPPALRPALYAVTALHGELARIGTTVSETLIGHIRLAWWREGLEEVAQGKPARAHPVLEAVAGLYDAHPTLWPHFLRMVEARAADMDAALIADEASWRNYLDGTAGALHCCWAILLGAAPETMPAIATQARGYAMVGLVRAIPYLAQKNLHRFPPERLAQHGLQELTPSDELEAFAQAMAAEGKRWLEQAPLNTQGLLPLRGLSRIARYYAAQLTHTNPYYFTRKTLMPVLLVLKMKFF